MNRVNYILRSSLTILGVCLSLYACQLDSSPYDPDMSFEEPLAGGEAIGGESVGGESVGGEAVGGEVVGGESVGGESVGGEDVGGEAVGGESVGGEAVGGEAVGGEAVGGEAVGGEAVGGESVGGEVIEEDMGVIESPLTCTVSVNVTLPQSTPSEDVIYLASEQFTPEWVPNDDEGLLERNDNLASGLVTLPNFTNVAYKFTRGDWSTVEVNIDCSEYDNRFIYIQCSGDEILEINAEVVAWKGSGGQCP